jgi:hypothetical protein
MPVVGRTMLTAALGAALALGALQIVHAATPIGDNVHACVDNKSQALFVAKKDGSCAASQTAMTWFGGLSATTTKHLTSSLLANEKALVKANKLETSSARLLAKQHKRYAALRRTFDSQKLGRVSAEKTLGKMDEEVELQLQMAMDRNSLASRKLSNFMAKVGDTQSLLVASMKS